MTRRACPPRHEVPLVCFLDDLARVLRTSRRTLEKMRAAGALRIDEMPSIDKRPRWSRAAVLRFVESQKFGRLKRAS